MTDLSSTHDTADGRSPGVVPMSREGTTIARNVAATWAYYVLVVVSGFILPRWIDDRQGADVLGVWDFAWSLASYLGLLSLGVVSAINRYVAKYRAIGDWDALNVMLNSSLAILCISCAAAGALAVGFAAAVPLLLPGVDPALMATARWTMLVLAMSGAVMLPNGVFEGVITGYERYELLNLIRGARDGVVLVVMILLLCSGHGVVSLAIAILGGELLADVVVFLIARRICPSLRLRVSFVRSGAIYEMIGFGGKTMLQGLARLLLYQTNSILVGSFLGPAVLAVYSRQRVLVMHALRLLKKYAFVFVPTSGRMHAGGDRAALRQLLLEGSRYGFYITTPLIAILVVLGGPLLELWMGADYRAPKVLAILALGHLLSLPQETAYSILTGMGRHGSASLLELLAACGGVLLGGVSMGIFHGGMQAAAVSIAVPVTLMGGFITPWLACRAVGMPLRDYFRSILPGPLLAVIPAVGWLVVARWLWPDSPIRCIGFGAAGFGLVLTFVYWMWVIPPALKDRLAGRNRARHPGRIPAVTTEIT